MIDLNLIKPNQIYRFKNMKCRFPVNAQDPAHGSVYVAVTKDMASTGEFFSKPLFMTRYLTKYYHDRIFNYRIYNLLMRYRISDKELKAQYDTLIETKIPGLSLYVTKATLVKDNYIYDISELNDKFFSTKDSRVGLKRVNEYFRLFKDFISKIDTQDYTNKVLFIPVDEWVTDIKDPKIYTIRSIDNFFSLFYHKLSNDFAYFKDNFSDWKIYFIFMDRVFRIDFSIMDEKDAAAEFKKLVYKINIYKDSDMKKPKSTEMVEDEDIAINEAKNVTAIADKIQEKMIDAHLELNDKVLGNLITKTVDSGNIDIKADNIDIDDSNIVSAKEAELEQIATLKDNIVPKSTARLARELKLVQEMKNLSLGTETLDEIQTRIKENTIPSIDIPVNTINPNLKKMKFPEFDKAYNDNLFKSDIVKMMTGLQYKDHPLYLISSEVKDASDELNSVDEYTFKFEDERGGRHTFQFLLPKLIDNRFMKLAGNKKIMIYQMIPLPVTKTSPDTVQVASNYKKTFISRFGQNISPKIMIFFKAISDLVNNKISISIGTADKNNNKYITTIEYDELASRYKQIGLPNITFYFSQGEIQSKMNKLGVVRDSDSKLLPIAIMDNKKVVYLNTDNDSVEGMNLIDYIVSKITLIEPNFAKPFKSIKVGKKYMYSRSEIMAKKVPLVLLLAYLDGLFILMKKANIKYRVVDKNIPKTKLDIKSGVEEVIEFQDAYLIYDIYPLRNILLMNGFAEIPTKIYDIAQFLSKDVYYEIFDVLFGRKNIGYAFENFQQLFIDPITEDVLRDYNLPTNFVELLLYANSLLEDNAYIDEGDMSINRVRSNEMINAFLYKTMATAYENYRLTANNPNPIKFSTKKDAVIISILTNQVTQDMSDLSPLQTIETMRAVTYKGPSGLNQDRAYSIEKRSYHPSMLGILSQASPISGSIGIARTLTIDANITSARGYMKPTIDPEEINSIPSTKMLSGSEAMSPFSASGDEPEREAMLSAQSKHTIACVESDTSPLSTGFEKALPYLIGNNFVYKADMDGNVLKVDVDNNVMLVRYNNDQIKSINLNPGMGRNTGGGFYVSNKLVSRVKAGDSIKANEILAYNPLYFKEDKRTKDISFTYGPLARVAVRYSSKVFEDSSVISKSLSEKMASDIVVKKELTLGKNSNIDYIVKKGQKVKVNEPLIVFDVSHEDELTNKILSKLKDENIEDLIKASKTPIVSKYNGEVVDIKLYYTIPKEELSESVRKIIDDYESDNEKRVKEIVKDTGLKPNEVDVSLIEVHKVDPDTAGKIKGVKVDEGILLEFYIKYRAAMGIGDKLSTSSAIKAVLCDVWEEGKEPYLLSNPNDKIDMYVGTLSIGARQTHSFLKVIQINGILVSMKDEIKKLYEQIYNEKL